MRIVCYDLFDFEGGWVGCISAGSSSQAMRRGYRSRALRGMVFAAWRRS